MAIWLAKNGKSIKELADMSGLSAVTLSKIYNCRDTMPTIETQIKLCNILECKICDLIKKRG